MEALKYLVLLILGYIAIALFLVFVIVPLFDYWVTYAIGGVIIGVYVFGSALGVFRSSD